MKYKAILGVVLTQISDEYFLVSARSLKDKVPYVVSVNDVTALCWKELIHGADKEELISVILKEFDVSDIERVSVDIDNLLTSLEKKGYIHHIEE